MSSSHLDLVEARIIRAQLERFIARDWEVRIRDEEEWAHTGRSNDVDFLLGCIGHSDVSAAILFDNGKAIGSVIWVHGNGEDVTHDCTARDDNTLTIIEGLTS